MAPIVVWPALKELLRGSLLRSWLMAVRWTLATERLDFRYRKTCLRHEPPPTAVRKLP